MIRISSRDLYGAARFCLFEARSADSALEQIDWILKAEGWREAARLARRRGQ